MKKTFLYMISATIGVCVGILLHCSFMVIEAKGCYMLPSIEPQQKVIVKLVNNNINPEDVVAFCPAYYTLQDEGNIVFRRVKSVEDGQLTLVCDASTTQREETVLLEEEVIGKVIFLDIK